ncbi:hypothetical protein F4803DRAFT_514755 [Xylaria telfairii]|nr:hypothetical protein F4803DRAFT_514755 [Xylaria telfairii]
MAATQESANEMKTKQTAHRHNHQTKTKRATLFLSHVTTWPFRLLRQTWKDHQSRRNMRKRSIQEQDPGKGDDSSVEAKDENVKGVGHQSKVRPSATDTFIQIYGAENPVLLFRYC